MHGGGCLQCSTPSFRQQLSCPALVASVTSMPTMCKIDQCLLPTRTHVTVVLPTTRLPTDTRDGRFRPCPRLYFLVLVSKIAFHDIWRRGCSGLGQDLHLGSAGGECNAFCRQMHGCRVLPAEMCSWWWRNTHLSGVQGGRRMVSCRFCLFELGRQKDCGGAIWRVAFPISDLSINLCLPHSRYFPRYTDTAWSSRQYSAVFRVGRPSHPKWLRQGSFSSRVPPPSTALFFQATEDFPVFWQLSARCDNNPWPVEKSQI